jgi:polyisoprenoid-binding protein YceI
MRAGLAAGAVAAIIAALVSLPLHSPVDSAFNSATVAVAALVVGVISGLLWARLSDRLLWFLAALSGLFILALVIAFVGNTQLDRMVSFMVPLAAIVVVICAVLTPLLASFFLKPALGLLKWSPVIAVAAALALGFGLMTQGDAESADLSIDPKPTAAAEPTEPGDGAQSFIVGEGSKITFEIEEELGRAPIRFNAVITGEGLSGTANLDGQPSVVTLDLHSLESDQQFRDQYIRSQLFPNTPEAVVTVGQLPDLPQSFFDGEETTGELTGSLRIGETVTPLVFDVTARNDGSSISVLGKATFTWEQLGLAKPTARSVVYLADEVEVQVLLIATAP